MPPRRGELISQYFTISPSTLGYCEAIIELSGPGGWTSHPLAWLFTQIEIPQTLPYLVQIKVKLKTFNVSPHNKVWILSPEVGGRGLHVGMMLAFSAVSEQYEEQDPPGPSPASQCLPTI